MKTLIVSAFLVLFSATSYADEWLSRDKGAHYSVSLLSGIIGNNILPETLSPTERIVYGTLIGATPGLVKEILDGKDFSHKDMVWNLLGAASGSLLGEKIRVWVSVNQTTVFIAYTGRF